MVSADYLAKSVHVQCRNIISISMDKRQLLCNRNWDSIHECYVVRYLKTSRLAVILGQMSLNINPEIMKNLKLNFNWYQKMRQKKALVEQDASKKYPAKI